MKIKKHWHLRLAASSTGHFCNKDKKNNEMYAMGVNSYSRAAMRVKNLWATKVSGPKTGMHFQIYLNNAHY